LLGGPAGVFINIVNMSDFILKFWPKENVALIKTAILKNDLQKSGIIADETEFWGKPAYLPGSQIHEFFQPKLERSNPYFETINITIDDSDYGVRMGTEDFEYIDRHNVISIKGGEGGFTEWSTMCTLLKDITGDEYEGGWEIL